VLRRRFLENPPIDPRDGRTTVLAAGAHLDGSLATPGDALIGGTIRGELQVGGRVHLQEGASVEGGVTARDARIEGAVAGPLDVAGFLEVGRTARVQGDLRAGKLAIAEGAVIQGVLSVASEPTTFPERREQDQS